MCRNFILVILKVIFKFARISRILAQHTKNVNVKALEKSRMSNFYSLPPRNFFEIEHKQENMAAFFSSQYDRIRTYLNIRQNGESHRR